MARQLWILSVLAMACLLAGCHTGQSFDPPITSPTLASPTAPVDISRSTEVDLVEKVAMARQQYEQALELLVTYYTRTGNTTLLNQASRELDGLRSMPHYPYIAEAYAPDASLKASMSIPEADVLFEQANRIRQKAIQRLLPDHRSLQRAKEAYAELIRRFPNSDKIDDAAFEIAEISRRLKDYDTALLYYQRAYQWDPATPHPARFQAARVLDDYLARRDEALVLYQQALQEEGLMYPQWKEFAEKRVAELTDSGQTAN